MTYGVIRTREPVLLGRFFLASGLFTLLLLLDDAFMLHERVLPVELGIRERYVKIAYLVIAAVFFTSFFKILIGNGFVLLAAAGACFSAGFLFDSWKVTTALGIAQSDPVLYLYEDGAKFLGIALWLAYLSKIATETLAGRHEQPPMGAAVRARACRSADRPRIT